ncbi:hypothetical protein E4T44_15225 [Aureobasidium sp. EXF-8845]|nr:hypothetical protein E4T44_15225 [Aureobasidium sp. EXF-8845]
MLRPMPMPAPMLTEKKKPNRNRNNRSHVKHPNLADARAVVVAARGRRATPSPSQEVMPPQMVDAVNVNARRSKEVEVVVALLMTLPRTSPEVMQSTEQATWSRTLLDRPLVKPVTHSVALPEAKVKSRAAVRKTKMAARASNFV